MGRDNGKILGKDYGKRRTKQEEKQRSDQGLKMGNFKIGDTIITSLRSCIQFVTFKKLPLFVMSYRSRIPWGCDEREKNATKFTVLSLIVSQFKKYEKNFFTQCNSLLGYIYDATLVRAN